MADPVERIGIRELRQHASRYIDQVEKGTTVEITKRDRPVARLVPSAPGNDRVAELITRGVLLDEDEAGDVLEIVPARTQSEARSPSDELAKMRDEERW